MLAIGQPLPNLEGYHHHRANPRVGNHRCSSRMVAPSMVVVVNRKVKRCFVDVCGAGLISVTEVACCRWFQLCEATL